MICYCSSGYYGKITTPNHCDEHLSSSFHLAPRKLPSAVLQRFNQCLISGEPTPEEDQKIIAEAMFEWAREFGAIEAWKSWYVWWIWWVNQGPLKGESTCSWAKVSDFYGVYQLWMIILNSYSMKLPEGTYFWWWFVAMLHDFQLNKEWYRFGAGFGMMFWRFWIDLGILRGEFWRFSDHLVMMLDYFGANLGS